MNLDIAPVPSDDELAAIYAALSAHTAPPAQNEAPMSPWKRAARREGIDVR